ncbi:MAG: InlB B-repeat-containing protein, partial [Erysipelotrichaceae bacterium]|nr:InlB B-repeat-containing protein [Erysipelotrichaceae bacterium]
NIEYELNGGKLAVAPRGQYAIGYKFALPTPTKSGYTFLGWTLSADSKDVMMELSETMTGNVKVYARFVQYATLSFELNEGAYEGTLPTQYIKGEELELPTPTKDGYKFMGWYDNAQFSGAAMTTLPATYTEAVQLYALWQVNGTFDMVYVLNGGNTLFNDRVALADALVADFNAYTGKKCSKENFFDQSYGITIDTANAFFRESDYSDKWGWLEGYFASVTAVNPSPSYASDVAKVRGDIHNFVNNNNGSIYGSDYRSYQYANGFWGEMQEEVEVKGATEILNAYYPFHTFLGWYDNEQCTGTPVRTLTASTTLYGKWEMTKLNVNYVLNNTEANMPAGLDTSFTAADVVTLSEPEYNPKAWVFDGWYLDAEFL